MCNLSTNRLQLAPATFVRLLVGEPTDEMLGDLWRFIATSHKFGKGDVAVTWIGVEVPQANRKRFIRKHINERDILYPKLQQRRD